MSTPDSPHQVLRLHRRSSVVLAVASAVGVVAFAWPLFTNPGSALDTSHSADAPWLFVLLLPLLAAVVLAELTEGALDAKAVALLGMLAAVGAALRALGPGTVGLEPSFIVILLGGRVFGRGFGFVLGALVIFAGGLVTGGIGPWLPFQMFAAAWTGFFAGSLPRCRGRAEVLLLAAYGVVSGLAFGLLMNLWFWPFASYGPEVSFVAGAPLVENMHRYLLFWMTTSLGWDVPRGLMSAVLVLLAGRPVLNALRRTARRAAFDARPEFAPAVGTGRPRSSPTGTGPPRDSGRPPGRS